MIAAALLLAAAAPQLFEIPPAPVLFVVLAPAAQNAELSGAEILETAETIFRPTAHIELLSADRTGVSTSDFAACPVEIRASCWVKLAPENTRVLIIASLQPDPSGRAIALAALDLRASATLFGGGSEEEIERAIWAAATKLPLEKISRATLRNYLQRAAAGELGALFDRVAPKSGLGSIRAEHLTRGAELELDGKPIGTATSSIAIIADVRAGTRRLRAESVTAKSAAAERAAAERAAADGTASEVIERVVEVRGGEEARADFFVAEPQLFSRPIKLGLGGVAVLAGAGLLTAGLSANGANAVCVHRAGAASSCEGSTPAFEPGPGGARIAAGDRGPPATLVIGAGVLALGATWSIGQWAFEDSSPWWSALAGLAAGLTASSLTYALSN